MSLESGFKSFINVGIVHKSMCICDNECLADIMVADLDRDTAVGVVKRR